MMMLNYGGVRSIVDAFLYQPWLRLVIGRLPPTPLQICFPLPLILELVVYMHYVSVAGHFCYSPGFP